VKRDPRLQPLSDDHHGALVLARRVRRAVQSGNGPESLWAEVARVFETDLEPHFQIEEKWLFPALAAKADVLVSRARADHAQLRALVRAPYSAETAEVFANVLLAHVRFEERALFPRAEAMLSDAALEAVASAAEAREEQRS
jgi:hemerythrin-like domain-containing protein